MNVLNLQRQQSIIIYRAVPRIDPQISFEHRERYLKNAENFAINLAVQLKNENAAKLYCPSFSSKPCQCIQNYLTHSDTIIKEKIDQLLILMDQAESLRQLKCHDSTDPTSKSRSANKGIGLGNGQKKNLQYVNFVLQHRKYLRNNLKFCEKATQKILCYSNNFIHKKLKSEPGNSARVVKEKLLIPIEELGGAQCCDKKCVKLAEMYPMLIKSWRERAAMNQSEARRTIAEMLTPAQGSIQNCFAFVVQVIGCCIKTVKKVNEQMNLTGGIQEPPEHGLKRWWRDQAKRAVETTDKVSSGSMINEALSINAPLTRQELQVSSIDTIQPNASVYSLDFFASSQLNQMQSSSQSTNIICISSDKV